MYLITKAIEIYNFPQTPNIPLKELKYVNLLELLMKNLTKVILVMFVILLIPSITSAQNHQYMVINFNMEVDPGAVSFFQSSFSYAESNHIPYVIIEMNTPGGYLDSMMSIVNMTLQAEENNITVITYVPVGGMAASAGSYIAMASDKIYMANGTFIGPSTPIVEGGNSTEQMHVEDAMLAWMVSLAQLHGKNTTAVASMVLNNTAYSASQAYNIHVIDGLVDSFSNLLSILGISNYTQISSSPSAYDQFISFISNPTVDGLLITIGMLAILLDIYHATVLLSITGIVLIALGLWGSQIIGGNIVGVVLILIGGALIIAEVKVGHGFLMITGVFLAIFGTWILASGIYFSPQPFGLFSYIAFGFMGGFGIIAAYYLNWIRRTIRTRPKTGPESIIGKKGTVIRELNPEGEVRVEGIVWRARSKNNEKIDAGKEITVVSREDLLLIVEEVK
ncbi:MAG: NfeD family protein [Thermoplasmata archaeon]